MSLLRGLALLIVDPSFASRCHVAVLPFLCSAAEKDDDSISVFPKVHAIAKSEIDAVLVSDPDWLACRAREPRRQLSEITVTDRAT